MVHQHVNVGPAPVRDHARAEKALRRQRQAIGAVLLDDGARIGERGDRIHAAVDSNPEALRVRHPVLARRKVVKQVQHLPHRAVTHSGLP